MSDPYADLYGSRRDPLPVRYVRWRTRVVIPACQFPQNYPSTTMRTRKSIVALFLVSVLAGILFASFAGCGAPGASPTTPEQLEALDDPGYQRFESRLVDRVSVGLGIALERGAIDQDDQLLIAGLLESIANGRIEPVPGGPISAVLEDAGLTDNEVRGVFLLVEDALAAAGVDFGLGIGPRTRQLLLALGDAVVSAHPTKG